MNILTQVPRGQARLHCEKLIHSPTCTLAKKKQVRHKHTSGSDLLSSFYEHVKDLPARTRDATLRARLTSFVQTAADNE